MALAFDKSEQAIVDAVTTDTISVTVPTGGVAAGSLVVFAASNWDGSLTLNSVSDTRGNTWTFDQATVQNGTDIASRVAYSVLTTSLQAGDTISAVWSSNNFSVMGAGFVSYTGSDVAASVLDQQGAATGTGTTLTSTSETTNQADEVIVGIAAQAINGTLSASTNFTARETMTDSNGFLAMIFQDRIVSSTGTYTSAPTSSDSDLWTSHILTFKAATAATQAIRPDADVTTTGWTTTPLWSKIDESSADGTVITATAS